MREKRLQPMNLVGRDFTLKELRLIKQIVALYPGLSRSELSQTICENISWCTPKGVNKYNSCLKALEKLEAQGHIKLPVLRKTKSRRKTQIIITKRSDPGEVIQGSIGQWAKVSIKDVQAQEEGLWNEYIERYHYLGYKHPFGLHQRYFIVSGDQVLGCILYAPSAWALECRDRWIGWNNEQKARNLNRIINNSRFLILPWVHLKNLASHALSLSAKKIKKDWEERFGYKAVLLESFVDSDRFRGTCYQAANWQHLGKTKARGRQDRYHKALSGTKDVYVYILDANFKKELAQ